MKKIIMLLLFLFASSGFLIAHSSEYGEPYGKRDENPLEEELVKSIEEVNEDYEVIEEEPPSPEESDESATEDQQESAQ